MRGSVTLGLNELLLIPALELSDRINIPTVVISDTVIIQRRKWARYIIIVIVCIYITVLLNLILNIYFLLLNIISFCFLLHQGGLIR